MKLNRWIYAAIGVLVMLFAGLIYAWSVLAAPIAMHFSDWTSAQLSLTFTICMMAFCIGGLVAGILSNKINVKFNMLISAVLFFIGFFIASSTTTLAQLYFGYGVLAGLAAGFAYNTVMGTISRYFPDKPGLISGILLMGFGMGSFLIGKVYQAYTGEGEAFRSSFKLLGIILFIVMLLSAIFIRKPSQEEIAPFLAVSVKNDNKKEESGNDFTTAQMLKSKAFWLYFFWAILLSASGLALIAQASKVAQLISPESSMGTISTVVGLISIFNGAGRVIFGGFFDKVGRAKTMFVIQLVFFAAIGLLILSLTSCNFTILIVGFIVMGLAYGGVTPTNSAFVSSFYGKKHFAVNFSVINMNLLIASFGGTIAGMLYDASASYFSTFIFMLVSVSIGCVLSLGIKRP